jgi:MFS family permease
MSPVQRAARRTFHSLRTRNFRLYFLGQVISGTGSWVQLVAQSWLVLKLTHSGFAVGITLGLQFAPMLLFGAWAGVLVDRLDKRRTLIATAAASGVLALVLGFITAAGVVEVWMVYALAFGLGVVTALDNPGRRAFVPEMVPRADIANAVGLNSTVFTAARVIGPAIAAIVIAATGVALCFILNAVSFIAVIWALAAMRPAELWPAQPVPRARRQLREGLRYSWRNRSVRVALFITLIVGTFAFNFQVVMSLLAEQTFHGGAALFGTMMAILGTGSLAGALWVAHFGRASSRIMIASTFGLGAAMTLGALAPSLLTEIPLLVAMGLTSMILLSMGTAVLNEETAPVYRGRVMALFGIAFLGSTPIGGPLVGWISEVLGARAGLGVGALASLLAAAIAVGMRRPDEEPASVPFETADLELATGTAAA